MAGQLSSSTLDPLWLYYDRGTGATAGVSSRTSANYLKLTQADFFIV
jgi:hypothetical protein